MTDLHRSLPTPRASARGVSCLVTKMGCYSSAVATGRSLELRRIQPRDRVFMPVPASRRRAARTSRHTRIGPQRDGDGQYKIWHTTMRRPWTLRAERRAAGRRQRRARKENRPNR